MPHRAQLVFDFVSPNAYLIWYPLRDILRDTWKRGGSVMIPAFAVGRAQEVILILAQAMPLLLRSAVLVSAA